MLSKYYRAIKSSVAAAPHPHAAAPPGSASRGAVLLAVCRGKVSEGIDFADANARAVVIVGIPYPNVKDKQVELKRQYNNEGARRGLLSGDQWYSQQAFRALNQAVGRCLRHRADHGAILLADDRYAHGANGDLCRHLPKWLRPATRKCASFEESKRGVRAFFDARAADPPRTRVEPETLALPPSVRDASKSNASCRTRKPREKVRAAADEGEEASNARGAQRDIKNFFAPVGAETGGGGGNVAVDDGGGGVAIENGSSRGVGSSAVAPGLHPHRVPLELAEARETRRGWTSAPPPPPLESDPRVTSQLTDPPTAPPTQDARTTSTLTEPNDAVTDDGDDGDDGGGAGDGADGTGIRTAKREGDRGSRASRDGKHAAAAVRAIGAVRARACAAAERGSRGGHFGDASRRDFSDATHAGIDARARGRVGRRRRRRDGMGWDARHAGHSGRRVGRVGRHAAVSRSHLGAGGAEADGADADGAEADGAEADATSVARGGFGRLGRDATRA